MPLVNLENELVKYLEAPTKDEPFSMANVSTVVVKSHVPSANAATSKHATAKVGALAEEVEPKHAKDVTNDEVGLIEQERTTRVNEIL